MWHRSTYSWMILFLQSRKITLSYNSFKQKYCFYFIFLSITWKYSETEDFETCSSPLHWNCVCSSPGMTPSCPSQKSWHPAWFNSFLQRQVHWLILQNIPRVQPPPLREMPLIQDPIISSFLSWMMDGPGRWVSPVVSPHPFSPLPSQSFHF